MIATLIGAGVGLAGALAGSIMSSKQAQKAEQQMRAQERFNKAMFNRQYYQDTLQRSDTQNMLRRMRNDMKEDVERMQNAAVVSGATPEAVAAAKAGNTKAYADTIAGISANDAQRKDAALANYQDNISTNSFNNFINSYNQQSQNWSNFASQAFQSGANIVGSYFGQSSAT